MATIDIEIRGLKETQANMERIVRDLRGEPYLSAMRRATLLVQRSAKQKAPVDTGRLRASITPEVRWSGNVATGVVGSNVKYSCIYNANTRIKTEDGTRTIGQIRVGDRVLTQTGEYRSVIAKSAFPVTEKPDLVDIEGAWRSDLTHKITVTADHKILVYRDGRNKWVVAGDLQSADMLYSRRKLAYNKGTGATGTIRICLNCGTQYQYGSRFSQGKKFCSVECRNEYWYDKGHNPHIGMKRSKEARANMSAATRRRLAEHPELHPSRIVARRGHVTECERQIRDWLRGTGFSFQFQKSIGTHVVDFYLPSTQTIIEADGAFWHQNQGVDIERDKALIQEVPDSTIVHIHFYDKRFTPKLERNPTENTYYVAVNPGMGSYADPTQFEARHIVSIRKWRYERPQGKAGSLVPKLYDLTVDGVHSFFANGILVSNSFVELGTRPHFVSKQNIGRWASRHGKGDTGLFVTGKAQPFLKPAFEENKHKIVALLEAAVGTIIAEQEE